MDVQELKREQLKLAGKIELRDGFSKLKTIGAVDCVPSGEHALLASVVVCEYPSLAVIEKTTYFLHDPLPFRPGYEAYREMPAIIEAYNQLEQEPDVLMVSGSGVAHPRQLGVASHVGLVLNKPTIGVSEKLLFGFVENGKIIAHNQIKGFEVTTREHSLPMYVSPGHLITLGSALSIVRDTIRYPHKLPEPLHLAHKLARKKVKEMRSQEGQSEKMIEPVGESCQEKIESQQLEA